MKKILINAISIKEGGALVVLKKLLDAMCSVNVDILFYVVIDNSLLKDIQSNDQVIVLTYPWIKKSFLHLLYWYEFSLPKIVKKIDIDWVFSQTNMLSIRKLKCSELLLVHHAGYFSEEYERLHLQYYPLWANKVGWLIRKWTISKSLKKANLVTVQTEALAKNIQEKIHINKNKIITVPHGPGAVSESKICRKYPVCNTWKIGYITKFGVQKNFNILFQAAAILKNHGIDFKLVLTLDETQKENKLVIRLIEQNKIEDVIENHGEINLKQVHDLYSTLDLFIFPSICESFGFTLVEAIKYHLPVIAADTPSNREILGANGEFFEKNNCLELSKKIMEVASKQDRYMELVNNSIERSNLFSWERAAEKIIGLMVCDVKLHD